MSFDNVNVNVSGPQQPASIYKTKVLKGQVPFATQVTEPNTKYVIKHNFVLDDDVTIPENCILEFDGGSISGEYTITGANTGINAGLINIFNTEITLAGTWNVAEAYPEWFGAKGDGETDDSESIQATINFFSIIIFCENTYKIDKLFIRNRTNVTLIGNNCTKLFAIPYDAPGDISRTVVKVRESSNINIKNISFVSSNIYDLDTTFHVTKIAKTSNRECINLSGVSGFTLDNCTIDDMYLGLTTDAAHGENKSVNIINCTFAYHVLMPMFITYLEDLLIANSEININDDSDTLFHHIYAHTNCKNHKILNCTFKGSGGDIPIHYQSRNTPLIGPLYIENCRFVNTRQGVLFTQPDNAENIAYLYIKDTDFHSSKTFQGSSTPCVFVNGGKTFSEIRNISVNAQYHRYQATNGVLLNSYIYCADFAGVKNENFSVEVDNCHIVETSDGAVNLRYNEYNAMKFNNCIFSFTRTADVWAFMLYENPNNLLVFENCIFNLNGRKGIVRVVEDNVVYNVHLLNNIIKGANRAANSVKKVRLSVNNIITDKINRSVDGGGTTEERPNSDAVNNGYKYWDSDLKRLIIMRENSWIDVQGRDALAIRGASNERPTLSNSGYNMGYTYFDTTLNKPIWWTGSAWVDATGATV